MKQVICVSKQLKISVCSDVVWCSWPGGYSVVDSVNYNNILWTHNHSINFSSISHSHQWWRYNINFLFQIVMCWQWNISETTLQETLFKMILIRLLVFVKLFVIVCGTTDILGNVIQSITGAKQVNISWQHFF